MFNADDLNRRAKRCREIAGNYAPDVGAPLLEMAEAYERCAQALHPVDQRPRTFGKAPLLAVR